MIVIAVLSVFLSRKLRKNNKLLNKQKDEIHEKNASLNEQNIEIKTKNDNLYEQQEIILEQKTKLEDALTAQEKLNQQFFAKNIEIDQITSRCN